MVKPLIQKKSPLLAFISFFEASPLNKTYVDY